MSLASTARLCALLALPLAAGCGQPQRPYSFTASQGTEAPIDTLVRALTTEGHPPARVSPEQGTVLTRWQHQGYSCSSPQNSRGSLMRRFTATVIPTAASSNTITLGVDVQCCTNPGVSADGTSLRGPCEAMTKVYDSQQREVNSLGAALQRAMSRTAQPLP